MRVRRQCGYVPDVRLRGDANAEMLPMRFAAPRFGNSAAASLEHLVIEVLDQGPTLSSCVANAGSQALRMLAVRDGAREAPLPARLEPYYLARSRTNTENQDVGTTFRDYFTTLDLFGIAAESRRYRAADVLKPPTANYMRWAYDQRMAVKSIPFAPWWRIYGPARTWPEKVKALIKRGVVVVGGFHVDDKFRDNAFDPQEPWRGLRDVNGAPYNHAMTIVGYKGDHYRVLNSWGTGFGDGGYCWLHAEYLRAHTHILWAVESAPVL